MKMRIKIEIAWERETIWLKVRPWIRVNAVLKILGMSYKMVMRERNGVRLIIWWETQLEQWDILVVRR